MVQENVYLPFFSDPTKLAMQYQNFKIADVAQKFSKVGREQKMSMASKFSFFESPIQPREMSI